MTVPFVLVISIFLLGLGWPLVTWLDRRQALMVGERIAAAYLLGCLVLYLAVSVIGLYSLHSQTMWALVAGCGLLSIPGLGRIPWMSFANGCRSEWVRVRTDPWLGLLWLTTLAVGASALLQGMAPPNDYDSLMYHLAQPQFDVEMGKLSVAWDRANGTELFPALAGHLSRVSLATVGPGAAQMLHGMLGVVGALGSALLALRLGCGRYGAIGAALFFLATRVVIWEMATVEVDVALAGFTIITLVVYLELRDHPRYGLAVLFGLLIGCCILVKYHGFIVAAAFAPLILWDLFRKRVPFTVTLLGPVVALLTMGPHMARNFVISGNPIYPIFNSFFNPDKHNFFTVAQAHNGTGYGTGRGLSDLLITPWNMFVNPMQVFDGMIFGAPFLLAFAPLILLDPQRLSKSLPSMSVMAVYFLGWFYLLDFQVRFLVPVVPVLCVVAVIGVISLWNQIVRIPSLKVVFLPVVLVLGINQSLFVGIYSIVRLPVALGLIDAETYHLKTPTMNGAMYPTCTYIRENLEPGERYFSLLQPHSYYCPQAPVVRTYFPDEAQWWNEQADMPPELSLPEFVKRAEDGQFKYYIAAYKSFSRRNDTARMIIEKADLSAFRNGKYLQPVFDSLTPLKADLYTAVYDGDEVLAGLKQMLAGQSR